MCIHTIPRSAIVWKSHRRCLAKLPWADFCHLEIEPGVLISMDLLTLFVHQLHIPPSRRNCWETPKTSGRRGPTGGRFSAWHNGTHVAVGQKQEPVKLCQATWYWGSRFWPVPTWIPRFENMQTRKSLELNTHGPAQHGIVGHWPKTWTTQWKKGSGPDLVWGISHGSFLSLEMAFSVD